MVDQAIVDATARRLSELDFSAENGRIAELEAEIERNTAAEQRARQRIDEILQIRRETGHIPSGTAVADQLLEIADLALETQPREELENERMALQQGIAELMKRSHGARESIRAVRSAAREKLAGAVGDLVCAIGAEAEQAAQRIADSHAALQAIQNAIGAISAQGVMVKSAIEEGLTADRSLLRRGAVQVPSEVADLLRATSSIGPAVTPRLLTTVALD